MKRTVALRAMTLVAVVGLLVLATSSPKAQSGRPAYMFDRPVPEPVFFAEGVVTTAEDELNAMFTLDGQTVYFTRMLPGARVTAIVSSTFRDGRWQEPQLASFSGQFSDYDPFITLDGQRLFFQTNRGPDGKTRANTFDIWFVERSGNGWANPQPVGAPVNSASSEYHPTIANDGTLYFSSNRPGGRGGIDIYRARLVNGRYPEVENLGEPINTPTNDFDGIIDPDQRFFIYAAYNLPDDTGGGTGDLYVSYNRNGMWTAGKNLGPKINTRAREYAPGITRDGRYFFYTSFTNSFDIERQLKDYAELKGILSSPLNGRGNVYQIDMSALGLEP